MGKMDPGTQGWVSKDSLWEKTHETLMSKTWEKEGVSEDAPSPQHEDGYLTRVPFSVKIWILKIPSCLQQGEPKKKPVCPLQLTGGKVTIQQQ